MERMRVRKDRAVAEEVVATQVASSSTSRRRSRTRARRDAMTAYALLIPAALFYLAFQFLPIIGAFVLSLFSWNGINLSQATYVGFSNFSQLVQDPYFWQSLRNNVYVALAVLAFQCVGSFLLAGVIHAGIRGARVFRVVFFAPVVVSSVAVAMMAIFVFSPSIGLVNTFLRGVGLGALAQPWLGSPTWALPSVIVTYLLQGFGFNVVLFLSALQQVPPEICEAALIDGASQRSVLWQVVLPMIRPVASVIVLLSVISAFRIFDTVYILTSGGPFHASDVLVTYLFDQAFNGNMVGYGDAVGVTLFLIIFVLALIQLRLTRAGESSL
jgi:raffinose/stachyose/melibiose transport system permease protein